VQTHLISLVLLSAFVLAGCGSSSTSTNSEIEDSAPGDSNGDGSGDGLNPEPNSQEPNAPDPNDLDPQDNNVPDTSSEFLRTPDRAIAIVQSLADFRARARDDEHGGFYSYLTQSGALGRTRPANENSGWQADNKSFVTQTRDVYTFSRAFMLTGNRQYLDHARHAFDFLVTHGRDPINGGWLFVSNRQGNPADCPDCGAFWSPNRFKWSFVQHYIPLGPGVLCEASRGIDSCSVFESVQNTLNSRMWDASNLGYYDVADADFSNPADKSFASIVDALNTHVFQSYLLQPSSDTGSRMRDLADITVSRFVGAMNRSEVRFGFPDTYTASWQLIPEQTSGQVGHLLKAGWQLARAYLNTHDDSYRQAAGRLLDETLDNGGWDDTAGVPYTSFDWSTGEITTTEAEYWPIEQAVTAGLSNWYINDDEILRARYLTMADRSLQFFSNHVIDASSGGTFMLNAPSGNVLTSDKGNSYKAEFHSTELFYTVYLYGNLMLQRRPVTLYYSIDAEDSPRTLQFNPLEIDNASLSILAAELDGQPLQGFLAAARSVTFEGGQGGLLKLTFGPSDLAASLQK